MIKKIVVLTLISTILSTGCWDNKDITEQSMVTAIGIDKGEKAKYKITLQFVKPSVIRTEEGGISPKDSYWTFTTEGNTIFQAIRQQLKTDSRIPFFSHTQIIILSEDIAKEGISKTIDLMERDSEIRLNLKVLISKDISPEKLLNLKSNLESVPSLHISQIMENNQTTNKLLSITIFDILGSVTKSGYNSAIGAIVPHRNSDSNNVKSIKDIKVEGSAIFKDDTLLGWLSPTETRALKYISGITEPISEAIIVVSNPVDPKVKASIEVLKIKTSIESKETNGNIKLFIKSSGEGNLAEQENGENLNNKDNLIILEKATEKKIKSEIENILNIAQNDLKSDFLSIASYVRRQNPKYWKIVEDNWNHLFCEIDYEINVDFEINKSGLTNKPILEK